MKKIVLLMVCLVALTGSYAQKKWSDLTEEEKMMKLKEFREDNQKYLKDKLGMTSDQLNDIDNVNVCYLSTLDRIDRYGKTDEGKEKFAEAATAARHMQLDAIMGEEKHKQFNEYVTAKLKKAKDK